MLTHTDVFVFTLGLTEFWMDATDGVVYPVAPGVVAGTFDPKRHVFHNQTAAEVVEDLSYFIKEVLQINPEIRFLLTVSPVPLAATAVSRHVLSSTTYSKSVLRVAAQEVADDNTSVDYFPSYEVITGAYNRGSYYAENLRDVVEGGVDHVMKLFFKHYASLGNASPTSVQEPSPRNSYLERAQKTIETICEEAAII
jgi:hypothetical protein